MVTKHIEIIAGGLANYNLQGTLWLPDNERPQKLIHVVHGMTEHIGRYERFAEAMTNVGIAVAGFDLRGHGRNSAKTNTASFISGGLPDIQDYGWVTAVYDIQRQSNLLQQMLPNVEMYLMGFSLGSFLVRDYMNTQSIHHLKGIILAGTGYQPSIVTKIMRLIAKLEINRTKPGGTTDLIKKLSFETYNKKFEPNRTRADWLCSDKTELDAYIHDPLCKKHIAADLFYELLGAMSRKPGDYMFYETHNNFTDFPVLLISGKNDPVGNMGKGIRKMETILQQNGMRRIKTIILDNARHDILHEYANGAAQEVISKIMAWVNQ